MFVFFAGSCLAQTGGSENFLSIKLPSAARQAALGGNFISISDADLNLAYSNPAVLNPLHHHQLGFNYNSYLAGTKYSNFSAAHHQSDLGTIGFNVQYFSYGEFTETNEFGESIGTFKPSDFKVSILGSREIDSLLSIGFSLNYIGSQFYTVNASALTLDLGVHYSMPSIQTEMGLVLKNMGVVLDEYSDNESLKLPFDIQFGVSKRLAKSPLRFTFTADNLQRWDLTYEDPRELNQIDPLTGELILIEEPNFFDKLKLHMAVGTEFLLGENMHFRLGYNFRRREELKIDSRPGTAGFSWGFGLKVSKFHLNYGRGTYILGQGTNHLSIATRLGYFKKK